MSDAEAEADETIDVFDELVRERDALREKLEVAEAKDQYMMARLTHYCDLSDALRAEAKALSNQIAVTNVELADAMRERDALRAEVERLRRQESPAGNRFDTEPKDSPVDQSDSLRAELAQERTERDATADLLRESRAENERLQTQIADALNEIVVLNGSINWLRAENERLKQQRISLFDER